MKSILATLTAPTLLNFGQVYPGALIFAAIIAVALPSMATFSLECLVGTLVAICAAYGMLLRAANIRLSWLMGIGLLLGYAGGSFNTTIRMRLEGMDLTEYFDRPIEPLCFGLALCLAVSAVLFFVGTHAERPVTLSKSSIHQTDILILLPILAVLGLAFASGSVGFQGLYADAGHRVSMLGELANFLCPVLPAATLIVRSVSRSRLLRILANVMLVLELFALLPEGRRALLYALMMVLMALSATGFNAAKLTWRRVGVLAAMIAGLYAANVGFYGLRVAYWKAGKTKVTLSELASTTTRFFLEGQADSRFDQQVAENLRDRTFILGYLSDMLGASWTHEPLLGADGLFCIKLSIPSIFYRDKSLIRDIGAEENIANPQFGLRTRDEANSILTTGISDFAIVGAFAYPFLVVLLFNAVLRLSQSYAPGIPSLVVFLSFANLLLQTEVGGPNWICAVRDLLLLLGVIVLFKGLIRLFFLDRNTLQPLVPLPRRTAPAVLIRSEHLKPTRST